MVCQRCFEDDIFSCPEAGHDLLNEGRAGNPEIIANYRLDVLTATTATGEIYEATNLTLDQSCVVKILASGALSEGPRSRHEFLREARLMTAVNHPNVIRLYDFGVLAGGEFYVVSEAVQGRTLQDCLNGVGAPTEITAVQIALLAAEGLDAIHRAGIVHRNINPENIIITSDAGGAGLLVKLQNTDFGGVKEQLNALLPADSETKLFDLQYYSPEQCDGQGSDEQADIYGLGVVLFEMLAGAPPFEAPDAAGLFEKHKSETPPNVKISNFDIRALLTHTLTDALQKIPRIRIKTANALARQLRHIEQLATHLPTPAPAMKVPPLAGKPRFIVAKSAAEQAADKKIESLPPVENELSSSPFVETPILPETSPVLLSPEVMPEPSTSENIENEPAVSPEAFFVVIPEINETPAVSEPVLIKWEQPEDIPTEFPAMSQAPEADEDFAPETIFTDEPESTAWALSEPDLPFELLTESEDVSRAPAFISIFSADEDAETGRFSAVNRSRLMSAGIAVGLIVVVIGGFWLSEQLSFSSSGETSAQTAPAEKILPKPAESGSKTEPSSAENRGETISGDEPPVLDTSAAGIKQNQPVSTERTSSPVSKRVNQTRKSPETNGDGKESQKNASTSAEASSNKTKQKPSPVKEAAAEKPSTTKTDALTRPRIVKNPGF